MDDAAIHRVSKGCVRVCLFGYWITEDRHGLRPRDDNMVEGIVGGESMTIHTF